MHDAKTKIVELHTSYKIALELISKFAMVMELIHHKVRHINTVRVVRLRKNFKFQKQCNVDSCEPNSSMLGAELAYDPKIKVIHYLSSTTLF